MNIQNELISKGYYASGNFDEPNFMLLPTDKSKDRAIVVRTADYLENVGVENRLQYLYKIIEEVAKDTK